MIAQQFPKKNEEFLDLHYDSSLVYDEELEDVEFLELGEYNYNCAPILYEEIDAYAPKKWSEKLEVKFEFINNDDNCHNYGVNYPINDNGNKENLSKKGSKQSTAGANSGFGYLFW